MTSASLLRHVSLKRLAELAGTRTGVLALTTFGILVVRMGSSIVLTRLLRPEVFGLIGIIGSLLLTVALLTDLGFQSYVVRHARGDERHFRNVIWTIHVTRGAALTVFTVLAAPVVAAVMHKPELLWPFIVTAIGTFFVTSFSSLAMMSALRADAARKLSLIDLSLQVFQTIACILLAIWLRSVWAIVIATTLQSFAKVAVSYWMFDNSRQRIARDRELSKDFFAFSRVVMASSALSLILMQSDKLVLGRLFTLHEFGLYAIAMNLASAPTSFASAYISRVGFPIFASTWRDNPTRIGDIYYSVGRLPSLLYAFACGGLAGGAGLIVAILYDPRYQGAAILLSLLSIGGALYYPNFAAAELQTAIGQVRGTLRANMVRFVWLVVAGAAGFAMFGAFGVVGAVGLMEIPALFYNWFRLRRAGVLDLRKEFTYLAVAGGGAASAFAVSSATLAIWPSI